MNIKKVALIHDWFLSNSLGGAEKVTSLIDKYLCINFNKPDIFCISENITKSTTIDLFPNRKIETTIIQQFPFGISKVQNYLPIIPFAIEQLNLDQYNLIFSSSHLAAKGILTSPEQLHISYIHTPMRYAWDQMNTYLDQSTYSRRGFKLLIRYFLFKLREWDYLSGQRPDLLIANSNFTARRIKKYWRRDSTIIHPPVNVERFNVSENKSNYYLTVNRLVPNKRIDLLVKAFNKLNLPLIIIGDGPEKNKLKKLAKSNIKILCNQNNFQVEKLMSECRAFVYAGIEDFGIAPVEAMAAGTPVIALGSGGLLDTVINYENCSNGVLPTGILFKEQSVAAIIDTINWAEDKKIWREFNSKEISNYANKFSSKNFLLKIDKFTKKSLEDFQINCF